MRLERRTVVYHSRYGTGTVLAPVGNGWHYVKFDRLDYVSLIPNREELTEPEEYWCFHCGRYVAIANLESQHSHGSIFP